jgi:AcrR family transcriptional regulator
MSTTEQPIRDETPGETASAPRGRPRAFDESEVIAALIELFWEQGYEHASLADIVETAGLNKSSLYNAFGSKDEIFFRAVEEFARDKLAMTAEALADGGLDELIAFFELQRGLMHTEMGHRGCMVVNVSTELGLRNERAADIGARFRSSMRSHVRDALARSGERGEVDASMVDAYADIVVAMMNGLAVAARAGAPDGELDRSMDSILTVVRSWRL